MASMLNRLQQLANDPRNRQRIADLATKAQQMAKDPKTRAKIEEARHRFFTKGGGRPH